MSNFVCQPSENRSILKGKISSLMRIFLPFRIGQYSEGAWFAELK